MERRRDRRRIATGTRWRGPLAAACLVAGVVGPLVAGATGPMDVRAQGGALFRGELPLKGRIATHTSDLPTAVIRCANCHPVDGGGTIRGSLAPRLDGRSLTELASRRGGPPARYDAASFCRLLRTGIDPNRIVNNMEMPRYDLSEPQCEALWAFLIGDVHG